MNPTLFPSMRHDRFFLMAGPCVIENEEMPFEIAEYLIGLAKKFDIPLIFKASYKKANRSRLDSFMGIGDEKALRILGEIRKKYGIPVVTDIHDIHEAALAAEYVNVLQIPAFLCRQTDLLVASGKTKCKVNIKKGQFLASESMKHPVGKVLNTRGVSEINYQTSKENGVWLCERGNVFGYGSLIVDMKNLITMRNYAPVIFDATHSAQVPSTGETTGGNSAIVPSLARAAAAVGVDGFFFETHIEPSCALSDGPNMLKIEDLYKTIDDIFKIQDVLELNK